MDTAATNLQASKLSDFQRVIVAIARNASLEDRSASYILPREQAAVRRLAARGILEITSVGCWNGHTEIMARLVQ